MFVAVTILFVTLNKPVEAKGILDGLVQKFPDDFEIRGLYPEAIGTTESDEFYREKALEALELDSTGKDKEKVPVEAKKRGYEFPIFYADEEIESDFKIDSVPKVFIINALGNIRFQKDGFNNNGYYLKKPDWMIEAAIKQSKS